MSSKKTIIDKNNLKNFGIRFRSLRETLGLKQYKMAELLGVSKNFISDIELGKTSVKMPILIIIENRWSITPNEILTGEGFDPEKAKRHVAEQSPAEGVAGPASPIIQKEYISNFFKAFGEMLAGLDNRLASIENQIVSLKGESSSETIEELKEIVFRLKQLEDGLKKHTPPEGVTERRRLWIELKQAFGLQ